MTAAAIPNTPPPSISAQVDNRTVEVYGPAPSYAPLDLQTNYPNGTQARVQQFTAGKIQELVQRTDFGDLLKRSVNQQGRSAWDWVFQGSPGVQANVLIYRDHVRIERRDQQTKQMQHIELAFNRSVPVPGIEQFCNSTLDHIQQVLAHPHPSTVQTPHHSHSQSQQQQQHFGGHFPSSNPPQVFSTTQGHGLSHMRNSGMTGNPGPIRQVVLPSMTLSRSARNDPPAVSMVTMPFSSDHQRRSFYSGPHSFPPRRNPVGVAYPQYLGLLDDNDSILSGVSSSTTFSNEDDQPVEDAGRMNRQTQGDFRTLTASSLGELNRSHQQNTHAGVLTDEDDDGECSIITSSSRHQGDHRDDPAVQAVGARLVVDDNDGSNDGSELGDE